jgi:hypothetical protein
MTNELVISILTLGEGLHNNHHRFPRDAYISHAWYEVGINGLIIRGLEKRGLVHDVLAGARRRSRPGRLHELPPASSHRCPRPTSFQSDAETVAGPHRPSGSRRFGHSGDLRALCCGEVARQAAARENQSVFALTSLELRRTRFVFDFAWLRHAKPEKKPINWWARQDSNLQPDRYERRDSDQLC